MKWSSDCVAALASALALALFATEAAANAPVPGPISKPSPNGLVTRVNELVNGQQVGNSPRLAGRPSDWSDLDYAWVKYRVLRDSLHIPSARLALAEARQAGGKHQMVVLLRGDEGWMVLDPLTAAPQPEKILTSAGWRFEAQVYEPAPVALGRRTAQLREELSSYPN